MTEPRTAVLRRVTPAAPLLAAALLASAGAPAAAQDSAATAAEGESECGYYCLAVAHATFAPDAADPAALRKRLGDPGAAGYSLTELEAAAERLELHPLAVDTSLENLRARADAGDRFAAVAHVDGNHFVLVRGFDADGSVEVIDPPRRYAQPAPTFAARWDGRALLVGPAPLTPESDLAGSPWAVIFWGAGGVLLLAGAGLLWRRSAAAAAAACVLFAHAGCGGPAPAPAAPADAVPAAGMLTANPPLVDAGTIPAGPEPREFTFDLTNDGPKPVVVEALRISCGCTDATVDDTTFDDTTFDDTTLDPGESTTLRPALTPREPEKRDASVTVVSAGDAAPPVRVGVRWRAVAAFEPDVPEIDFGALGPGATAERTVRFARRPEFDPAARLGQPYAQPYATPRSALTAAFRAGGADLAGDDGPAAVRVRLTAPAEQGPGRGTVTVGLTDGGADRLLIPVRWEVRDVAAVRPATLALPAGPPGAEVAARAVVAGDGPLTVVEPPAVTGGERWTAPGVTVTRLTDDRILLDFRGTLPETPGRYAADLAVTVSVETADGPVRRTLGGRVTAFVTAPGEDA